MPLYEYKCKTCGGTMEVLQKYSDAPPECQGFLKEPHEPEAMERQMSTSAAHFKGSGFHATDYGKRGPK